MVTGQKIPFFADPDQPFNQVMAMVALRAKSDKIILGGMGMTNDDYLFFKNTFSNAGALDRIVSFINTTEDPSVERILIRGEEREGLGIAYRYDQLRRCLGDRIKPYGPDPV